MVFLGNSPLTTLLKNFSMKPTPKLPRIEIHYCRQCGWLLRSTWYAQELLTTFAEELGEVALSPGTGGIFRIFCDDEEIWDRKSREGFPDIKELKQLIRNRIAPDRSLGHSDRKGDVG
jgi:selenoprotein W-related protein